MLSKTLKHALLLPIAIVTLFASALYSYAPQTTPKTDEKLQLVEFDVSIGDEPPRLPTPTKTYEFFTSYAHPQWTPPDDGIVDRLKSGVIDIVHNYPGRNPDYPDVLDKLARHLEGILRTTSSRVERQEFNWKGDDYVNVIASYGPESGSRIVIGAHYDAVRTSPGADDNASAVAVLLELARHFGKNPPNIRVDLAAYTLEEEGWDNSASGSFAHAKSLKEKNVEVKAMFSLEMVGYYSDAPKSQKYPISLLKLFYPSKGNFITVVSKSGTNKLVKTIKKAMAEATPLPVETFVAKESRARFIGRSDHRSFWSHGYPAVMITNTAEFRNFAYHTPDDVPERLDYRRMAMVAVGVINAVKVLE